MFRIKNPRWADYWQQQAYAVMAAIRTSDGEISWIDLSACLKRESAGWKTVRQIVFAGERFDAVSVQNWRKRVLGRVGGAAAAGPGVLGTGVWPLGADRAGAPQR